MNNLIRVAVAQISPVLGDVDENLDIHLRYIEKARAKVSGCCFSPNFL